MKDFAELEWYVGQDPFLKSSLGWNELNTHTAEEGEGLLIHCAVFLAWEDQIEARKVFVASS